MTDKKLILTKEEASHVAQAMCTLNNVNAKAYIKFYDSEHNDWRGVVEHPNKTVVVSKVQNFACTDIERYDSQNAFFDAYGV